jgi:RimJ/RimL family protein N-acetyltransferase
MQFPIKYSCLYQNQFEFNNYKIIPIRYKDRIDIMKWRNEQVYHLRQSEELTTNKQDNYFKETVANLFTQEKPNQILFSYLENEKCIGYGGLVHINWIDKNAEISFIMNTELEKEYFSKHWSIFLKLLENVAFKELTFHKIYTYAFDLRKKLYSVLEYAGFNAEAVLYEHCFFDNEYKDVLIHSKFKNEISLNSATLSDLEVTYKWVNDKQIRRYSFNKYKVTIEEHENWFKQKLNDPDCLYFIAVHNDNIIGSLRFDIKKNIATLSYLVSPNFHGNGYGTKILSLGIDKLLRVKKNIRKIVGFVMPKNLASVHIFEKLLFSSEEEENYLKFFKDI